MIKFLDLAGQYQLIKPEIDQAICKVIAESAFIGGKYAKTFEQNFAAYIGAEYCVGVGNGTDALEIAIETLNLPSGSEIIVPGNSFIATSEAVTRTGHNVVFADINPESYNLTAKTVQDKLTNKTSAVIAVHLYGNPCEMEELVSFCEEHDLKLIEDCAQAHGAEYKGTKVGLFGDISSYSFYPGKNLGAYGDAGAIITQNGSLAIQARKIANHGRIAKYDHEFEGRNSRMDGIQAAILDVKLRYLDQWTQRRIDVADRYKEVLDNVVGLVLPKRESWVKHVFHLFVVRTESRDDLQRFLKDAGIQTGVHYPVALPKLKAYVDKVEQDHGAYYHQQDKTLLSLPMGEHLTIDDIDLIAQHIKAFFDKV